MKKTVFLLLPLILTSCSKTPLYQRVSFNAPGEFINNEYILPMNTVSTLTAYEEDKLNETSPIFNNIINTYSKQIDRYHDYEGINNVKTINDSCGSDQYIKVSKELYDLIKLSYDLTIQTSGKFNLFIGNLVDLYSDYLNGTGTKPSEEKIQLVCSNTPSYLELDSCIEFDESNLSIKLNKFNNSNIKISLGGIGKGYVVDKLYKDLDSYNYPLVISCGSSSMALLNSNPLNLSKNYNVGIRNVAINSIENQYYSSSDTMATFSLPGDYFISTSGDDEQFIIEDNIMYCHILNTYTGKSNHVFRSVSLLTSTSNNAILDCLSTACFNCSSVDDAISLIHSIETIYNLDIEYCFATTLSNFTDYEVYIDEKLNDKLISSFISNVKDTHVIERK